MDYRDRVAIVTGASSGIGEDVAKALAARGARVLAVARRRERLEALAAAHPNIHPAPGDAGDRETARRVVAEARERWGRLDVLVNNAGIPKRKHILDVTWDDVRETLATNLEGPIAFVLEALPLMLERGEGWIVNVSSIAGRIGNPRESIYAASKYGITGFTETVYFDLHRRGIHTAVVHPGPIATEIWDKIESPAAYRGKLYPPADVTAAVLDCIENRRAQRTVPRSLGFVAVAKALVPRALRWGLDRFDPDTRR